MGGALCGGCRTQSVNGRACPPFPGISRNPAQCMMLRLSVARAEAADQVQDALFVVNAVVARRQYNQTKRHDEKQTLSRTKMAQAKNGLVP